MATPTELKVTAKGRILEIAWDDGGCSSLEAGFLRANCRSAAAVRASIVGGPPRADDTARIAALHLVGSYGVNLVFSDGEDRGIYPWAYLRELSARSP